MNERKVNLSFFLFRSSSSDGEVKMAERNYCAVLEKAGTDQQEIKHGCLFFSIWGYFSC